MLKIALPDSMKTTLLHLERAGRAVIFYPGQDIGASYAEAENYHEVMALRSLDIPAEVADSRDVGLCGADCVQEKELELGLGLKIINKDEPYNYGREILNKAPRLELVVCEEEPVKSSSRLKPGIILGEHPFLIKEFLEEDGWKGRVVQMGRDGAPGNPKEFRQYCQQNELMGIRIVHGKIGALVRSGAGYGVQVNETNKTIMEYQLKVLDKLMDTPVYLIADPEAASRKLGVEIMRLHRDLIEAYRRNFVESEASEKGTESRTPKFAGKER